MEGRTLVTDGLSLDLHVLLARGYVPEVWALCEGEGEGMKDGDQCSVQGCQGDEEEVVGSLVDHAKRPGATAAKVRAAGSRNDLQCPVCVTCWVKAQRCCHLGSEYFLLQ
jgi:hypothetical protein